MMSMRFWVPDHRALSMAIAGVATVIFIVMLIAWFRQSAFFTVWKDDK